MLPLVVLPAAVVGPAVAGLAWLAFARSRPGRRIAAGVLAVAAHASAWVVFWLAYRGEAPAWGGMRPDLLGATLAVAAQLGMLLAAARSEARAAQEIPSVVVGLAVSASAVVVVAFSPSLVVLALFVPIPTLAAAVAGLSAAGRRDAAGLLGIAAADAVALAGLSLVLADTGTTVSGPTAGFGPPLLLAAAAAKAGAIPGLATWRLVTADGPARPFAAALRAQGFVLAALATTTMWGVEPRPPMTAVAAAAVLTAGIAAAAARTPSSTVASVSGAAAAVAFVALGLGGAVGARAFLLLFPAFLLAAGAADLLTSDAGGRAAVPWSWTGAVALGVVVGSLAGMPPGGGFPGTWLALSLSAVRGDILHVAVAVVAAAGLAVCLLGALPLLRWSRPARAPVVLASAAALALLYIGVQPVRLGLGWWVRVEAERELPVVLAASGAPALPAVSGVDLALVAAPALVAVVAVAVAARGFRAPDGSFTPLRRTRRSRRRRSERAGAVGAVRRATGRATASVSALAARASRLGVGLGAALVVEAAVVVMALRMLFLGVRMGFL